MYDHMCHVLQAANLAFGEKRRGELAEDVIDRLADAICSLYENDDFGIAGF